jgi:hypothetical protein
MPFNPLKFQESINKEFELIKDRVDNLIDIEVNHHGENGAYKEAILRKIIKRFLPKNISIGTGFIVTKNDNNTYSRTTQIDIILYDNNYPLLFNEGDFIITTPKNVKAIIEVKTTIRNSELEYIIVKSKENMNLIGNPHIFNGIFSYNYNENILLQNNDVSIPIIRALENSYGKINHISLGSNIFIKYWDEHHQLNNNHNCNSNKFFNIYDINNLSFSYFISNLIDYVIDEDTSERDWFMFPIVSENGKEDNGIGYCCIQ